jgi:hypothetical protein
MGKGKHFKNTPEKTKDNGKLKTKRKKFWSEKKTKRIYNKQIFAHQVGAVVEVQIWFSDKYI